jgi:hypothetical protein
MAFEGIVDKFFQKCLEKNGEHPRIICPPGHQEGNGEIRS